jgi:phosphoribosylformylglycinamidine synthase
MPMGFSQIDDLIYLLGTPQNDVHCSEYLNLVHGVPLSVAPWFDLESEYALQQLVQKICQEKIISAAHDVSEGGLLVSLFESAFAQGLGFKIKQTNAAALESLAKQMGVDCNLLGHVTPGNIVVDGSEWGNTADWKGFYDQAIGRFFA